MSESANWQRFKSLYWWDRELGIGIDVSRMGFDDYYLDANIEMAQEGFAAMRDLERGANANPDEKRMVGHYWLRAPELSPTPEIRGQIEKAKERVKQFARQVAAGKILGPAGKPFQDVLLIGIGGSALGPELLHDALASADTALRMHFVDNTDPDGIARTLDGIPELARTLSLVISKSGGTKETRNGQLLVQAAYERQGVDYTKCFVAVTGEGSALDKLAKQERWLECFPMWDWVGGRTSLWSPVGLLPAALEGFDIDALLQGARKMDIATRVEDVKRNPAVLLALMWYYAGRGRGEKAMVVLPYKDRLAFLARYLQQLLMESLGKELDLEGKEVHQGLTVFGNKGSTDQHAYVQQLRDGINNFFVVFISVLADVCRRPRDPERAEELSRLEVEPNITAGDYLHGFLCGTREALSEKGRESLTISLNKLDEQSLGALLALFERAVGFYASYVYINAYHQPGVEAGKRAARDLLVLQAKIIEQLRRRQSPLTVAEIADSIQKQEACESIFAVLRHLAVNGRVAVETGGNIFEDRYFVPKLPRIKNLGHLKSKSSAI